MTHFVPPRPDPLPAKPSLYRRLQLGMRSGLSLFLDGAFRIPLGRYAVPVFPWFKRRWVFTVRDPELIRQVLVTQAAAYPKHDLNQYMLRHLTADNVFVTNGEAWRRQRRLVDQAFEAARIKDVFPMMREACDASVERVGRALAQGTPSSMRIDAEMTHFAADIIFRTIYSEPIPPEGAQRIFTAFETFQHIAYAHGMLRLVDFPAHLLPGNRRAKKAGKVIREILRQPLDRRMAALRRGEAAPDDDILAGLIAATDPETGKGFDEAELLDEIAMLFLAGHETSASGMAWALYLLANDQAVQDRLHAEAVEVLGERAPAFADMKRLAFTRVVFREALRLYPPVAFYARSTSETQCLHNREIEPQSAIFVSPWLMQRHEKHWREPDAFDPDRFATEEGAEGLRGAFLPFSMGPRVCVGAAFAMQEATLLLAQMVRRFRFLPQPGHTPDPIARLTLRSANGVPLLVERR